MYNPVLSWLNQHPRPVLVLLFAAAHANCSREQAGLLPVDMLKAGLIRWAEAENGVASLAGLLEGAA